MTILTSPKFNLIGHRGVAGLRPENTLVSFQYAAELGLNWIEFDVQLTKDEQWIVLHDETLERTTNGHGKVSDYTLRELTQLEAGLWYTPSFKHQLLPSLEQVLDLANRLNLNVNIEIKGAECEPDKHAALLSKFLANFELHSKPLISSFDLACITSLAKGNSEFDLGYLVDNFANNTVEIAKSHGFKCINCDVNTIRDSDISLATNNNLPVMLYTINDPQLAKYWLSAGITAIFTDRPDLLLQA